MIKALSNGPDPTLLLGLSDLNWSQLRDGHPIMVELEELVPGLRVHRVLLIAGPTEESMYEDLRAQLPVHRMNGGPPPGEDRP